MDSTNTTTKNTTTKITGNKPEKKFRAGPISATIWENQGQNKAGEPVTYRTISIERNYKDKNDQWKSTNSFRINDLPKVTLVSSKAFEYLAMSDVSSHEFVESSGVMPEIDEEIVM